MLCPSGGRQKVQARLEVLEATGAAPGFALVVDATEASDSLWEAELVHNSGAVVATTAAADVPQTVAAGTTAFGIAIVPGDLAAGYYVLRVRFVAVDAAGSESISVAESFLEATAEGIDIVDSADWFSRAGPVSVSDEGVADE
ncbi:MAG: hypothetical protein IT383_10235 [Deltaproteobacteria bacterium]|nr:hypothetical protein [Deltaproteobacteria bacterium]